MSQKFFARQEAALLAALTRTRQLIIRYLGQWHAGWPHAWDFNLLHDLEDRLEQRLTQVHAAYFNWHFATFGWVAI